jgi:hypothetical protein
LCGDADQRQVVRGVRADDVRKRLRAVPELDLDRVGTLDDVEVRQRVAVRVDDEPRAEALRGLATGRSTVGATAAGVLTVRPSPPSSTTDAVITPPTTIEPTTSAPMSNPCIHLGVISLTSVRPGAAGAYRVGRSRSSSVA